MPAPQAKFEFVATGDAQVNAQVQAVVDKLVQMRQRAIEGGKAMSDSMLSTKEDVRAIGEALETKLPRPLANVIASFQSLKNILAAGGVAGAIGLGVETAVHLYEKGQEIYDKWLNINTVIDEYNKKLTAAGDAESRQVTSLEQAYSNLRAMNAEADRFARERMSELSEEGPGASFTANLGLAFGGLALGDPSQLINLSLHLANEKDALAAQLASQLQALEDKKSLINQTYDLTVRSINAQKELNDTTLQGAAKIKADKETAIQLADLQFQKDKELEDIQNQIIIKANAADGGSRPLIPFDAGKAEHDLAVMFARADATAKYAAALRDAMPAVQQFQDTLASLRGENDAAAETDPYQQQLDQFDSFWQKRIRDTMDGSEKQLAAFRKLGIDTTDLEGQLDDTLLSMYEAYMRKKDDLINQQHQELMTGGIKPEALPSSLFVTNDDKINMDKARALIDQITAALQAEKAKEQELKDEAAVTGETQIELEAKLLALRTATSANLQDLVTNLKNIGQAIHAGIGDQKTIDQADKLKAKIDDLNKKTQTWATELKKTVKQDFEDAFVGIISGTESVSQAFTKMGEDILKMLAKVIYEMYIVKLLQSAMGGIFGGGNAGSAGSATGGSLSGILTGAFGGGRAGGGPVLPGMSYNVGENGPETLVMGRSGGYVIPNSGGRSGGGVQVNIHNYGQPMDMQQSSRFDGEQYVVDVVVKNIQSNGQIRQAMK